MMSIGRRVPLVGRRFEFEDGDLTSSTPPCNACSESADGFRRGIHDSGIPDCSAMRQCLRDYPDFLKHSNSAASLQVYYNSRLMMITVNQSLGTKV